MANAYSRNPIVLDTFSSAIDVGSTLFGDSNARVKVEKVLWAEPTVVGHTLAIYDGGGSNLIASATCTTADETKRVAEAGWYKGIRIAANGVGSGRVFIYLDQAT